MTQIEEIGFMLQRILEEREETDSTGKISWLLHDIFECDLKETDEWKTFVSGLLEDPELKKALAERDEIFKQWHPVLKASQEKTKAALVRLLSVTNFRRKRLPGFALNGADSVNAAD